MIGCGVEVVFMLKVNCCVSKCMYFTIPTSTSLSYRYDNCCILRPLTVAYKKYQ